MAMIKLTGDAGKGTSVELYQDGFSLQYAVELAGVPFYDSCQQDKARAVYEFLLSLSAETLHHLAVSVPPGGSYTAYPEVVEQLAGLDR